MLESKVLVLCTIFILLRGWWIGDIITILLALLILATTITTIKSERLWYYRYTIGMALYSLTLIPSSIISLIIRLRMGPRKPTDDKKIASILNSLGSKEL